MLELEFGILDIIQTWHTAFLDELFVRISELGNAGKIWIIFAIFFLIRKQTRKCGIHILIALSFCLLVGNLGLKILIARERPCMVNPSVSLLIPMPRDYSFPSGHTMSSFAAAAVIYYYSSKWGKFAFLLATLIAFSRLYLYVHYPSDVLAGGFIGVLLAYFVVKYLQIQKNEKRNFDV